MNYAMHKLNKEGTVFRAAETFASDEYAERMMYLHLREQITMEEYGRPIVRYRLHAMQPHSIEMALAYEINCPKCGHRLKQVGRCLNSHELGLYACPACDNRYPRR